MHTLTSLQNTLGLGFFSYGWPVARVQVIEQPKYNHIEQGHYASITAPPLQPPTAQYEVFPVCACWPLFTQQIQPEWTFKGL